MKMTKLLSFCAVSIFAALLSLNAAEKRIVFVAGKPSHGPGDHEHNAGSLLLKNCLTNVPGVKAEVHLNGWPTNDSFFDGADAIVLYMDGGEAHPVLQGDRLKQIEARMKKGVGLALIHYAVEPTIQKGQAQFLDWIGGAFEINRSVNPHWDADFKNLPNHPITRGVKPFKVNDECYFNMRFQEGLKGVTPILSAVPTESTMSRPDGDHSGNPAVREAVKRGDLQHVAWAYERAGGGRGFGFTGAHHHNNWGNDDFRKLVLNAVLWVAHAEVPAKGVESKITPDDLDQNLDPKGDEKKKISKPAASSSSSRPKYKSGLVTYNRVPVDVDITGAKKLWLVVTDGGNTYSCDWADWGDTTLIRADGTSRKLTQLKWDSASTGWGNVGVNQNVQGGPLQIGKKVFTSGIGTHAPSIIEYTLPEAFARFQAKVGIDVGGTEQSGQPAVEFLVFTEPPPADILLDTPPANASGETFGPKAAAESQKFLEAAEGLEATLVASEPLLRNPTNIDIDDQGRIWVAEGVNYRSSFQQWGILDPAGDRIVILEDTNHDGTADTSKVFYQDAKLAAPLGICVLGKKVIVSASPEVFILTDSDGDDKADQREVLFSGIEGVDHDHGVHAISFGPDGKLYFNFGNNGSQLKRPDGSLVVDIYGHEVGGPKSKYRQGMAFRCNMDGSEVEVLGHNFRNPYEVCVDSFGTVWQSDNDDDGNRSARINYIMPGGNYGYSDEMTGASWNEKRTNLELDIPGRHWHLNDPGVVPNVLITGAGAPCGIAFYEGKLLPKSFQNQMIHADAGPRVVRTYPVKEQGAGYSGEMVEVLSASDAWFRPSDVCVAPDGSVYVADWNDSGVGGHNMADRSLAQVKGRIYRLAPPKNKPAVPHFNYTRISGAVEALQSPNNATRYLAWDQLFHLGKHAEPELAKLWKAGEPRMRARALQLLARIEGKGAGYITEALKDGDANIRIAALRIARDTKQEMVPILGGMLKDPSLHVRRECALSLRGNTSPEAADVWTELALQHDGKDRWFLEALGIGATGNESASFAAWLKAVGDQWNTPAGRDIVWRSRDPKAASYLAKLIADSATPPTERARYFRAFDFLKGAEKEAALVELVRIAAPQN